MADEETPPRAAAPAQSAKPAPPPMQRLTKIAQDEARTSFADSTGKVMPKKP